MPLNFHSVCMDVLDAIQRHKWGICGVLGLLIACNKFLTPVCFKELEDNSSTFSDPDIIDKLFPGVFDPSMGTEFIALGCKLEAFTEPDLDVKGAKRTVKRWICPKEEGFTGDCPPGTVDNADTCCTTCQGLLVPWTIPDPENSGEYLYAINPLWAAPNYYQIIPYGFCGLKRQCAYHCISETYQAWVLVSRVKRIETGEDLRTTPYLWHKTTFGSHCICSMDPGKES